jgi:hypothetical protein
MQGRSETQRSAVARIGVPLCTVTAGGGLGTFALVCGHNAAVAIACAVPGAVAVLCTALPDIIRARAEAANARERTRQRTLLLKAGLERQQDVTTLLALQPLDADVLKDPGRGAAALSALLRIRLPRPRVPSSAESALANVLGAETAAQELREPGKGGLDTAC